MLAPPLTLGLAALVLLGGVTRGQQQNPAPRPAPGQAGPGRGGLDAEIAMGANFDPKPPVTRLEPADEQKRFLLPPGFTIEPFRILSA